MTRKFIFVLSLLFLYAADVSAGRRDFSDGEYNCTEDGYCETADKQPLTGTVYRTYDEFYETASYRNGRRSGLTAVYRRGTIFSRTYYKKGLKNGEEKLYYPNRTISVFADYRDGLLDGRCDQYYENGKLKGRMTYRNGEFLSGYCVSAAGKNKDKRKISGAKFNEIFMCGEE